MYSPTYNGNLLLVKQLCIYQSFVRKLKSFYKTSTDFYVSWRKKAREKLW
jgi:hypothetical protein